MLERARVIEAEQVVVVLLLAEIDVLPRENIAEGLVVQGLAVDDHAVKIEEYGARPRRHGHARKLTAHRGDDKNSSLSNLSPMAGERFESIPHHRGAMTGD